MASDAKLGAGREGSAAKPSVDGASAARPVEHQLRLVSHDKTSMTTAVLPLYGLKSAAG